MWGNVGWKRNVSVGRQKHDGDTAEAPSLGRPFQNPATWHRSREDYIVLYDVLGWAENDLS